ncbi:hypothetical protein [Vibrio alginolyticus]|uniref:hypothetical protein n=1 Tax=Vibrio alginolyticus TaxID=663 RepID=UPI0015F6479C|nr:hypothetical protein [Vibrio alginolyticus]
MRQVLLLIIFIGLAPSSVLASESIINMSVEAANQESADCGKKRAVHKYIFTDLVMHLTSAIAMSTLPYGDDSLIEGEIRLALAITEDLELEGYKLAKNVSEDSPRVKAILNSAPFPALPAGAECFFGKVFIFEFTESEVN